MKVNVLKKEKELLEIEIPGGETLAHLLARFCEADAAAVREHPFLTEPKLVIYGKDPEKALVRAIDNALSALEEFKNHFKRALKEV